MSPRTVKLTWIIATVTWVLICSVGWYVATRDDYFKLRATQACYAVASKPPGAGSQCANIRPPDILVYKAAIDRKARISRVAAALGSAGALALWLMLGRPGLRSNG
jgi:hypothetical protein